MLIYVIKILIYNTDPQISPQKGAAMPRGARGVCRWGPGAPDTPTHTGSEKKGDAKRRDTHRFAISCSAVSAAVGSLKSSLRPTDACVAACSANT